MASKQQAYDHPAYEVPVAVPTFSGGTMASGQVAGRFAAWTAMILKAAQVTITAAGTNTSTVAIVKIAAASTATSTIKNFVVGTGTSTAVGVGTLCDIGTAQGLTANFNLGTLSLAQGDVVHLLNGIDLSLQFAIGIEAYITPGANLTV